MKSQTFDRRAADRELLKSERAQKEADRIATRLAGN